MVQPNIPAFCKLPKEIRYEIYGFAVGSELVSRSVNARPITRRRRLKLWLRRWIFHTSSRDRAKGGAFANLILVNKDISAEVKDFAFRSCRWIIVRQLDRLIPGPWIRGIRVQATESHLAPHIRRVVIELEASVALEYMAKFHPPEPIYDLSRFDPQRVTFRIEPGHPMSIYRYFLPGGFLYDGAEQWISSLGECYEFGGSTKRKFDIVFCLEKD